MCAVVLLETGSSSHPYPYEVLCHRPGASWQELSSCNGPGRHQLPDGRSVVTFWGGVEEPGRPVVVSCGERTYEASVSGGYLFLAIWDPPSR